MGENLSERYKVINRASLHVSFGDILSSPNWPFKIKKSLLLQKSSKISFTPMFFCTTVCHVTKCNQFLLY